MARRVRETPEAQAEASPAPADLPAAEAAEAHAEAVQAEGVPSLPAAIRIVSLHGFVGDDGVRHMWLPGHVVTDPDTVALLISRGARHETE